MPTVGSKGWPFGHVGLVALSSRPDTKILISPHYNCPCECKWSNHAHGGPLAMMAYWPSLGGQTRRPEAILGLTDTNAVARINIVCLAPQ